MHLHCITFALWRSINLPRLFEILEFVDCLNWRLISSSSIYRKEILNNIYREETLNLVNNNGDIVIVED